jgi:predicted nucleic acid-binding protein
MYVFKFFFETTLFNAYHSTQSMVKQQYTRQFFQGVTDGKYVPYTSIEVIEELKRAPKDLYEKMHALVDQFGIETLHITEEVERMADRYISKGIIPEKYREDALHIAVAAVNGLDAVVSYNFEHIAKLKTINRVALVNIEERYKVIGLPTPEEVIEHERN